ncbi:hypothetical protein H2O64_19230 [Kordia sp. YSTF-M3]|uniref:Uncharacterized protein n=1 Tax=Kordia aestuariivivens TaxID=2759037 RepID=A0ABR7QE59_9FLAO|nr:hypothetical protein [Kordia aestuariivivens]MBC8756815.1 hypothetical protein [Kordia aestuariivivens]
MKIRFLLCVLVLSLASCTKTITETVIEKEIIYLQTIDDNLTEVTIPELNIEKHQFKIEKVDSLITYQRPKNYNKAIYNTFQKKYKFDDTFEGKFVLLDSGATLTKSATMTHRRFSFFDKYSRDTYIVKKFTKTYKNLNFEGYSGIKHIFQVFNKPNYKKSNKPLYKVKAYGSHLQLYDREGYFVCSQYGCCMSSNTYELFDLQGNYILSSNDNIKSVKTEKNYYYIGILKNEIPDIPVLFIKEASGSTKYISFLNINFDNIFEEHFYLKFKNQKSPFIPVESQTLSEFEIENLDDLELWFPFNKKDTLKIPFKNEKAFGVDYPQIKISLSEK